ncbi:hypothetical protein KUTeg_020469 [Tegillarca granosa]|uniref:Uncharacterized protein n=1 Tax=Tegillarca granosa TaxID=220873 RepID=A0ABQ9ED40_TEGGR|nr:hypothetical protein KUTeg_020469 [Tegillarca granosa]
MFCRHLKMAVPRNFLVGFILSILVSLSTCKVYDVAMDGAGCGTNTVLTSGDSANLKANGPSPNKNCSATAHVDEKCIGLTVRLEKLDLPCNVTVTLSGLWFDLRGDRKEVFRCNSQPAATEEIMFRGSTKESTSLTVKVTEPAVDQTYSFLINIKCENASDYPVIEHEEQKRKGFSGFKAKFSLNRHKDGDSSPEKPKEEYRKVESPTHKEKGASHETLPLVAAAAATAVLDDTLHTEDEEKKKIADAEPKSTPEIKVEEPSQPESPSSDNATSNEPAVTSSYDHGSSGGGGDYGGGDSGGGGGGDSGGGDGGGSYD